MALLKIISNKDCDLYIDQEKVCHISKEILHKESVPIGEYLVDLIDMSNKCQSFDLCIDNENQQILKRIYFSESINDATEKSNEELIYIDICTKFVRNGNTLLLYKDNCDEATETFLLCGEILGDSPIPVAKEIGFSHIYGYVNRKGEIVLPFIYESVSNFSDSGYAEVQRFGIKRFINKDGKVCILNTIEEIENNNKLFYILEDKYEWCGRIEMSAPRSYFLSGCYRIAVLKEGKWGYCFLKEGNNHCTELHDFLPFEYDYPFGDSKYGFVTMRKGRNLCIVNLNDAKYNTGEKKGQYLYGEFGTILYQFDAEELYPILNVKNEWRGDGRGGGWFYNLYSISAFVIKCNGRYGIVNLDGSFRQRCMFDDIYNCSDTYKNHEFLRDVCIVQKGNVLQLMNINGKILVGTEGTDIYRIGKFWAIKQGQSYRLYEDKQNVFTNAIFEHIEYGNYKDTSNAYGPAHEGYDDYIITLSNKKGIVNGQGEMIASCLYDEIVRDGYYSTFYRVCIANKHGIINDDGNMALDCEYDSIKDIPIYNGQVIGGFVAVSKNGSRICRYHGDAILSGDYDDIKIVSSDYNEFAVSKGGKYALFTCKEDLEESIGFATKHFYEEIYGEKRFTIYDGKEYDEDGNEYDIPKTVRLYLVKKNGKVGVINNEGIELLEPKYDNVSIRDTKTLEMKYRFMVQLNGKYGVIQEDDAIEIPINYGMIDDISYYCNSIDSYIVYNNEGKIALMSDKGEIQSEYKYDEIKEQRQKNHYIIGYSFRIGALWGFLSDHFHEVIPNLYESIRAIPITEESWYRIDYFIVSKSSKYGVINDLGKEIIAMQYDDIDVVYIDDVIYFIYSNKKSERLNDYNPFIAFNSETYEEIQLETTNSYLAEEELRCRVVGSND